MPKFQTYSAAKFLTVVALLSAFLVAVPSGAEAQEDLHRHACANAHCRKIKSFLHAHYCGRSPYGNGPEDGCQIMIPRKPRHGISVLADFNCEWSETRKTAVCHQRGQPSPKIRKILARELHDLGLPPNPSGKVYFVLWKSSTLGCYLALADYSRLIGDTEELSEVLALISPDLNVTVLRKVPFQRTDADVANVTEWFPVDITDVDGNGNPDVILEGDAYEDHWLEVVAVRNGSAATIFSGLGYYL